MEIEFMTNVAVRRPNLNDVD
ncbi:GNAT family N-acetyltransferase, partial [Bacillus cereus]